MKVKELLESLAAVDDDADVLMESDEFGYCELVTKVESTGGNLYIIAEVLDE